MLIHSLGCGGAERTLIAVANHMARRGDVVNIATLTAAEVPLFYEIDPGVSLARLNVARNSTSLYQRFSSNLSRVAVIRKHLREFNPDLVLCFLTSVNALGLLATRGMDVPVIISERQVVEAVGDGRRWKVAMRALYRFAARLVVPSKGMTNYYLGHGVPVQVIPNPAPDAEPRIPQSPLKLIAAGRLSPEKGFDLLLDSFQKVVHAEPHATLTIYGEGICEGELRRQAEQLGISGSVTFAGVVSDLRSALQDGSMLLLTSRHESFANVLVEAMSCGLPVVSFDCPHGPADIIRDGEDGLLVPAGDTDAFADAVLRLIRDPRLFSAFAARAPEVSARFNSAAIMRQWETLFDETQRRTLAA